MSFYHLRLLKLQNASDLRAEMQNIGADLSAPVKWETTTTRAVKIENIATKLARFLYQEMMMEGGAVILPARMDDRSTQPVAVLMLGTPRQLEHLSVRLQTQNEEELNLLADELVRVLN